MQPERKVETLPAPDRLDSWKEIAAYLNRSERTVRRWEAKEELPVHRLQHDKRGSVYAYTRELDAWRASRTIVDDVTDRPQSTFLRAHRLALTVAAVVLIAVSVAAGVWWRQSTPNSVTDRGTTNDEAWRLSQLARFGDNAGRTQIETGIRYYRQAVELDPKFAQAWAGLATGHVALTFFGERRPSDTMSEARRYAEEARRLNAKLSGPWRVLAFVSHYLDWNHKAAEAQFQRAIALGPDAVTLSWYGDFLTDLRRFDEARAAYARAHDAGPRWLEPIVFAANVLTFTGQPAMAIVEQQRALETEPNYGLGNHALGRAYLASGDFPRAIQYLRKSNEIMGSVPFALGDLGYALAVGGQREEAERLLHELRGRRERGYYPAFALGEIELGLGHLDAALDWLEYAIDERYTGFYLPSADPIYAPLRSHPRFRAMLAKMNLPS